MRFSILIFLIFLQNVLTAQTLQFSTDTTFGVPGGVATVRLRLAPPAELMPQMVDVSAWKTAVGTEDSLWVNDWERHGTKWELPIRMQFLDTGSLLLPPLEVVFLKNEVETSLTTATSQLIIIEPFPITDEELADVKDILAEPMTWRDILTKPVQLFLLGLAALVGLLVWYFRYRKKNKSKAGATKSTLSPSANALQRLKALKAKKLHETEAWKAYYSELTFIFRSYLDEQHGIDALESTSDEIIELIQPHFSKEDTADLSSLFRRADMVKFAKGLPPEGYWRDAFDLISRVVG